MGCRLPEDQFAEIRVYRDQDSVVLCRSVEKRSVARIRAEFERFNDIVSFFA